MELNKLTVKEALLRTKARPCVSARPMGRRAAAQGRGAGSLPATFPPRDMLHECRPRKAGRAAGWEELYLAGKEL